MNPSIKNRPVTGTHIAYLHHCLRKLWLFAHGLQLEHRSELVAEGKWIGETAYAQRATRWQELAIEGIKIDHYDAQRGIVKEVKKSPKNEALHIAQVKYYLFILERNGIKASHGLLEYPQQRQTLEVYLENSDRKILPKWETQVREVLASPVAPERLDRKQCNKCSYEEFCWVD